MLTTKLEIFSPEYPWILLRHLHCLAKVRYCSPRCFHPNDVPSLADGTFPHDEVELTSHKKLTFGVAKVALVSTLLFKDYMVNFTHFCHTCDKVYTHHIDNFQETTQCLTLWKISLENFCKNFFQGCNITRPSETHLNPKSRSNPFEILHKYCRALCNISERFEKWEISYGKTSFCRIWGRVTHICVSKLTIGAKALSEPMLEYC